MAAHVIRRLESQLGKIATENIMVDASSSPQQFDVPAMNRRRRRWLVLCVLYFAVAAGIGYAFHPFFLDQSSAVSGAVAAQVPASQALAEESGVVPPAAPAKPPSPPPVAPPARPAEPPFAYKVPPGMPLKELLPRAPRLRLATGPAKSDDLSQVIEVTLGASADPMTPGVKPRENLAEQIVKIQHLNKLHVDGFMRALVADRVDLAGLPFAMGDDCRMDDEQGRQFEVATAAVRSALSATDERAQASVRADAFWTRFAASCREQDATYASASPAERERLVLARLAALVQVLGPESEFHRKGLAQYLAGVSHVAATRSLARIVLFSAEALVRDTAIDALQVRREQDYTALLIAGLSYPRPAVAERAADALVRLGRHEAVPQLVALLDMPDPRMPANEDIGGVAMPVVRELVKLNHHRNCLLCHAPAANTLLDAENQGVGFFGGKRRQERLTAAIAVPGEALPTPSQGYMAQSNDLLVRIDVTYLRQDFSLLLPVEQANPWPTMQRFDFLVRKRVLSVGEAALYRERYAKSGPGAVTPYERAILGALRDLTGRDTEPSAAAWRRLLGLASPLGPRTIAFRRHPPSPQPPLLSDTEVAWTYRQSRQQYVMGLPPL
jgi:hypothetical protein